MESEDYFKARVKSDSIARVLPQSQDNKIQQLQLIVEKTETCMADSDRVRTSTQNFLLFTKSLLITSHLHL